MERYQQAMVNIMTPVTSTTTLICPAGTPQDPSYLTVPFTAPSEEPMTAKEPMRPQEQEASMFIAGSDRELIIGMSFEHIVRRIEWVLKMFSQRWCKCPLLGGDGGHALCLQEDLVKGYSEPCDTFKSIPLCKGHFKIQALEVWGIQNSISFSHSIPSQ